MTTVMMCQQRVTAVIRVLLIVALLLGGGCSSVRLAYSQLDWWMDRALNKYLELDGSQKELLFLQVDEFHLWHRQTQLPRYANYMEQLAVQVDSSDNNAARIEQNERQLYAFWQTSVTTLSDLMLPILIRLDDEQIARLTENVRERREESLKKWEKPRRRLEQELYKQAARWLGELTPEQEAMLDRYAATTSFDPSHRDAQRQRWASAFLTTLRNKPPGYKQTLREMLVNPQSLWPEDYRRRQEQLRAEARSLAGELLQSFTPEQRRYLKTTLLQYATDFRILAAK